MNDGIEELASHLGTAERIVFITGAGMSTESGIPDFRSATGLYATGLNEDMFSIDSFTQDPARYYRHGRDFHRCLFQAKPNAGHQAIAALATDMGKDVVVVTQNIDTLHRDAGSPVVHALHGSIETCSCMRCGESTHVSLVERAIRNGIAPRHSACGGIYRPDIVLFGELLPVDVLAEAEQAIGAADLLVVVGTSLVVHPAAALPDSRGDGCILVMLNRTATHLDPEADLVLRGTVGDVLFRAVSGSPSAGHRATGHANEPPALRSGSVSA